MMFYDQAGFTRTELPCILSHYEHYPHTEDLFDNPVGSLLTCG
jgi:hypothetical protein